MHIRPSSSWRNPLAMPACLRAGAAFTLIEMLVASAVLALMIVLATQLVTDTSRTINTDGRRMDADSQARLVFDRIALDLSRRATQPDLDIVFSRQSGNDKLFFFSEVPGITAATFQQTSSYSLVGYRIQTVDDQARLERLSKGVGWQHNSAATSLAHLTFDVNGALLPQSTIPGRWPAAIGSAPTYDGADSDYLELGSRVFRLELCFVLKDGSLSLWPVMNKPGSNLAASAPPGSGNVAQSGARWFDRTNGRGYICTGGANWSPIGFQDVAEIVVGLGILDSASRSLVSNTSGLVSALPDLTEGDLAENPPRLMAQVWDAGLQALVNLPPAGVPKEAASQVRFYQRHFYLAHP